MDKMDEGGLSILSVLLLKRFFGGEGVPPSHVQAGKEVVGIMQWLRQGCCLYVRRVFVRLRGRDAHATKSSRGFARIYTDSKAYIQ